MTPLYKLGYRQGKQGYAWMKAPAGMDCLTALGGAKSIAVNASLPVSGAKPELQLQRFEGAARLLNAECDHFLRELALAGQGLRRILALRELARERRLGLEAPGGSGKRVLAHILIDLERPLCHGLGPIKSEVRTEHL